MVGPLVLLLILLFLIAGLVVIVRALLIRVHRRVATAAEREQVRRLRGGAGSPRMVRDEPPAGSDRPGITGRMLKGQYLRGEISKSEYDARLRRLQLDEYLEDER